MDLPDGTVLMHGHAPYDPQKAHEYYLRTRHLHPRQHGPTYTVKGTNGITRKLSQKEYAEQQAYAAERVTKLKARLVTLTTALHEKIAAAKKSAADANKPKTAAEKHKEAQAAKKYRQEHKQSLRNKAQKARSKAKGGGSKSSSSKTTHHTQSIAEMKGTISKVRDNLKAAVATQRALASAKKNG